MEEIPKPDPSLLVGLTYNLKRSASSDYNDDEAEYDSIETVLSIKNALESGGSRVTLYEATKELPEKLAEHRPDIVFNIAEGFKGRGREAQVPAILNFFGIPFTGSDETTLCVALDKALTKRILATYHIRTPKYKIISKDGLHKPDGIDYPVIVKPNAEGSSKGITDIAIARDREQLESLIAKNISKYNEDMLAEEYIDGREFTVGIIGNGEEARVFPPMEIIYLNDQNPFKIYSLNVKQNFKKLVRYECPASLDAQTEAEIIKTSLKIYRILGCRDFSRIDYRLSRDGKLYFIEINPLPGLAPGYSDYPMIAEFNGIDYVTLVRSLLGCALKRYSLF